jgi:Ca-activated chloride channel homolog
LLSRKLGYGLLVCGCLYGQVPDAKVTDPDTFTFRTDTRLVDLHATVLDKAGHLVLNLPQSAFTVYENGVKQEITTFRREDVPVSLGLVIDNSASMHEKRAKVGSAALALVKASNPEDEVFILNFNEITSIEADYTNDIDKLADALKTINSKGGTAMRDALRMGIEHLRHGSKREKKILLVVTDGEDNASVETLDHVIQSAQQNGVIIYSIGLLSDDEPHEAERAKRALDALTFATGGQVWYPQELSEVDGIAHEVAHEIRSQYILGYTPTNLAQDGTFRRIRVTLNAPGDPTVRTRSGYYASVER